MGFNCLNKIWNVYDFFKVIDNNQNVTLKTWVIKRIAAKYSAQPKKEWLEPWNYSTYLSCSLTPSEHYFSSYFKTFPENSNKNKNSYPGWAKNFSFLPPP